MPKYKPPWPTEKREPFPQEHHIVPLSRGGEDQPANILTDIPSDLHWCWHRLFGNLTPMETLTILVQHLLRPGKYHGYQNLITGMEERKPPVAMPDKIIFALENQVFPRNWVPSKKLIRHLERLRKKRSRES